MTAITAAENPDDVAGMILLFPAFVMADDAREQFSSVQDIPETSALMQMNVGKAYYDRLLDNDFYDVIGNYDKDVLIMHGDKDNIVPLSYSERAVQVYPSAELVVIPGAGHGFMGEDAQTSIESVQSYIHEHLRK